VDVVTTADVEADDLELFTIEQQVGRSAEGNAVQPHRQCE